MNRAWFLLLVHHDPACAVSDLGLPERYSSSLLKFAAMITSTASGSSGRARLLPV